MSRGIRHRAGLPLRGQRTKNNSRTRKENVKQLRTRKQQKALIMAKAKASKAVKWLLSPMERLHQRLF